MKCSKCHVTIYDKAFKYCPVCGEKISQEEEYEYEEILDFSLLKSVVIVPFLVTNLFLVPLLLTYVVICLLTSTMEPLDLFLFTMHYFLLVVGLIVASIFLMNLLSTKKKISKSMAMMAGLLFISSFLL